MKQSFYVPHEYLQMYIKDFIHICEYVTNISILTSFHGALPADVRLVPGSGVWLG